MSDSTRSLPHRLLSRYGGVLLFVVGLPLVMWLSLLLLPVVGNFFGIDLLHHPSSGPLSP